MWTNLSRTICSKFMTGSEIFERSKLVVEMQKNCLSIYVLFNLCDHFCIIDAAYATYVLSGLYFLNRAYWAMLMPD